MGVVSFLLGGARSGKSRMALELARKNYPPSKIAFVATCNPGDPEMQKRVKKHQKERPKSWSLYEAFGDPLEVLEKIQKLPLKKRPQVIILDCLSLYVSNRMFAPLSEKQILAEWKRLLTFAKKKLSADLILVSNEVGLSIVPENRLARDYRDTLGRVNQLTATRADHAFFMVAGLAIPLTFNFPIGGKAQ
ncbi:MAG: bifunctional adenosylcobinamide kinase/adenosylcobinamide-phosphate guanylyltransferase [Oligoflexia bacterium]|nr:bifunctional adenosylcobinamide kinase/adenosylcobinamide-phosphate guanylyltransferase [Oligoflexia bacterium]